MIDSSAFRGDSDGAPVDPRPSLIVRKRKFDGSIKSEWQGELLSTETAEWLVVLHHPARHLKFSGGMAERSVPLFIHCLNTVHPLTVLLTYAIDGRFLGAKCDAALPARRMADGIEFVDLDLDLLAESDLSFRLRDEDTFAQNRVRMAYPEAVVQQARSGIELAQGLVASQQFPFDERFVPRLTTMEARTAGNPR